MNPLSAENCSTRHRKQSGGEQETTRKAVAYTKTDIAFPVKYSVTAAVS